MELAIGVVVLLAGGVFLADWRDVQRRYANFLDDAIPTRSARDRTRRFLIQNRIVAIAASALGIGFIVNAASRL